MPWSMVDPTRAGNGVFLLLVSGHEPLIESH